jgi:hypothetical protein
MELEGTAVTYLWDIFDLYPRCEITGIDWQSDFCFKKGKKLTRPTESIWLQKNDVVRIVIITSSLVEEETKFYELRKKTTWHKR